MVDFVAVIPARYASTRLPGKPLANIGGKPMIQHVFERASESQASKIVIATDDQRIAEVVEGFGGQCCMTSADHQSGTDRIAEVVEVLDLDDSSIVVNLQGDEPLMPPVLLNQVAIALDDHPEAAMSTLAVPLDRLEQVQDPNVVKVVTDKAGLALYFSRATIPWNRDLYAKGDPSESWKQGLLRHLGIYAYRGSFLRQYSSWEPSPLENVESLEQLRVLWHGLEIAVDIASEVPPAGVDSQEDLDLVRNIMLSND